MTFFLHFVPDYGGRFGHACGSEAEADPHAAAHASRRQPGVQQQRAPAAPGELLPLHPYGHCLAAHLHTAGCLLAHRYPQTGISTEKAHVYSDTLCLIKVL